MLWPVREGKCFRDCASPEEIQRPPLTGTDARQGTDRAFWRHIADDHKGLSCFVSIFWWRWGVSSTQSSCFGTTSTGRLGFVTFHASRLAGNTTLSNLVAAISLEFRLRSHRQSLFQQV